MNLPSLKLSECDLKGHEFTRAIIHADGKSGGLEPLNCCARCGMRKPLEVRQAEELLERRRLFTCEVERYLGVTSCADPDTITRQIHAVFLETGDARRAVPLVMQRLCFPAERITEARRRFDP